VLTTSANMRNLVQCSLVAALMLGTFFYALGEGMHHRLPHAVGRHVSAFGIAISELRYGTSGYTGYNQVFNTLQQGGLTTDREILLKLGTSYPASLERHDLLNQAFAEASSLGPHVALDGPYHMVREDVGMITFYKLAFALFGFRIESPLFLYFLLFSISMGAWLVTFSGRAELQHIAILLAVSHFLVVASAGSIGVQLYSVSNTRFLPALGVLPAIHLGLLVLGRQRGTPLAIIMGLLQVLILCLVIHARTSARYQLIFLFALFAVSCASFVFRHPHACRYVLSRVRLWPVVILFAGFLILKLHFVLQLDSEYTDSTSGHVFWHAVYIGLSAHPESESRFGITIDDNIAMDKVRDLAPHLYRNPKSFNWEAYEAVLKTECLRIMAESPGFVFLSFAYKPYLFVRTLSNDYLGGAGASLCIVLVLLAGISAVFAGPAAYYRLGIHTLLSGLSLICAFLPSLLYLPSPHVVADSVYLTVFFVLLTSTGMFSRLIHRHLLKRDACDV
jgi:hypothetical protein